MRDLDHSKIYAQEADCNKDNISIISTAAGSNTITDQCYNYGGYDSLTFNPPTITNPTTCSDTIWLYTIALDSSSPNSPLPANLQFSINSLTNTVSWNLIDNS